MHALTMHSRENGDVVSIARGQGARWSTWPPSQEMDDAPAPGPYDTDVDEDSGELRGRVVVAHGDEGIRRALTLLLQGEGYDVCDVDDSPQLADAIARIHPDVILLDLDAEGVALHAAVRESGARLIALTALPAGERGALARKQGAFELLGKPVVTQELLLAVSRAAQAARCGCTPHLPPDHAVRQRMIGATPVMERLFTAIARVAPLRTTVLITGETGTGKELVARAIHELSDRARKPFVPVHCAALPETLLESELFGHVRGSFTGALTNREGLIEAANGGTLFLDEISTLSPSTQVKLLRVLQERSVQRIGSNKPAQVDFRLVAASNVDLAAEVAAGRFREDLYYRINVFPLAVPALRERKADIPHLVDHFRLRFAEANGVEPPEITPESVLRMMEHDWPGNVRELENMVERTLVSHLGARTARFDLPTRQVEPAQKFAQQARRDGWDLARLEREYILRILEDMHGRRGEAADRLGIDRRTLGRKLDAYERGLPDAALATSDAPAQRRRKPRGVRRPALAGARPQVA